MKNMARTGLTKSQVRETRDQLLAEGRYPSVDAVRHALGDTGSKSTIHKHLKELAEEDNRVGLKREDTTRSLHALVEQLAEQLHQDAERRYEAQLEQKDQELAALRRESSACAPAWKAWKSTPTPASRTTTASAISAICSPACAAASTTARRSAC
jgi:hypothetical protein